MYCVQQDVLMTCVPSVTPSPCCRLPPEFTSLSASPCQLPYSRLVAPPTRSTPIVADSIPQHLNQTPGIILEMSNITPLDSRLGDSPSNYLDSIASGRHLPPGRGSEHYVDSTSHDLTDPTLGRTRFTMRSPMSSHRFQDEEAELQAMIDKLDAVYPDDMSHSSK